MKSKLFTAALAALMLSSCTPKENGYFDNLPQEANPIEIGIKLRIGFWSKGIRNMAAPYEWTNQEHKSPIRMYALGWEDFGLLRKQITRELTERLKARFEPLFTNEAYLQPSRIM